MRRINPTLPHATLLTQNTIPYVEESTPSVDWQHKMKAIKRHGFFTVVMLILYWRMSWDTLVYGTIPAPQLRLPRW